MKWSSIVIAYICIFLLSYELGTSYRRRHRRTVPTEARHLTIKRLFHDHGAYLNSSIVRHMIDEELQKPLSLPKNRGRSQSHGLVLFYDLTYHQTYFHQFLWLYSSWLQLPSSSIIQHDLIVFLPSITIPKDFQKLLNYTKQNAHHRNQLKIFFCPTLIDALIDHSEPLIDEFSLQFQMELARVFVWQETRLASLFIFINDECQKYLRHYDLIFRFDCDSFFLPNFAFYSQSISSLIVAESIPHDRYTINRLQRIGRSLSFSSSTTPNNLGKSLTITWFAPLSIHQQLTRRVLLLALWLMKEEFTESERIHHLTYFNYPSWYIDGIFAYASSLVLSQSSLDIASARFDCQHTLNNCLHLSLRDPSHHLHFSKHSLRLLDQTMNRTNLTEMELYIYRTVIKSNGLFRLEFASK